MTNVIRFPDQKRAVITYGSVSETRTVGANGTRRIRRDPPELRFFVKVHGLDGGGRALVWDGDGYRDALDAAHMWEADGYRLEDRVARDAGAPHDAPR